MYEDRQELRGETQALEGRLIGVDMCFQDCPATVPSNLETLNNRSQPIRFGFVTVWCVCLTSLQSMEEGGEWDSLPVRCLAIPCDTL